MIIKTKFDVGQEVWAIGLEISMVNRPIKGSVFEIRAVITTKGKNYIAYYLRHRSTNSRKQRIIRGDYVAERNLFLTRAAARAEIKRRKAK
jgi:hypothetical protein